MSTEKKLARFNEIISLSGFSYELCHDIFVSRTDAWQREFGYQYLYDENAVRFNMVFDCEPIYFDFDGHTWMLEFWKGQYGINIGGEIGVYRADSLVSPADRKHVLFHTVPDKDMLTFSLRLINGTSLLYTLSCRTHWWLAGFCTGSFSLPELLKMKIVVTFHDKEMMYACRDGMYSAGYSDDEINISATSLSFVFDRPKSPQPRISHPVLSAWALWKNRLFLRLYCHVTKDFCHTLDKLLYLYEYLPKVFQNTMRMHFYKDKPRGGKKL